MFNIMQYLLQLFSMLLPASSLNGDVVLLVEELEVVHNHVNFAHLLFVLSQEGKSCAVEDFRMQILECK